MEIEFLLGERREITLHTSVADGRPYTLRNPTYRLSKYGVTEAEGVPRVEGHDLLAVAQPQALGQYTLEFTFELAGEIIKKRVLLHVR